MLFNSFQFAFFFALVFVAFLLAPARHRAMLLLVSSLIFYTLWIPRHTLLLLLTLGVNYLVARRMSSGAVRRRLLISSIVFTLSLLAIFKYSRALLEALAPFVQRRFDADLLLPELYLPLGISFYTFEVISLSVDIYRGRLQCPSLKNYFLFVTFFPHLIAGPIMRGQDLIPQLERGGERTSARTRRGLWLLSIGLVKKTILSDFLLQPYVNEVFLVPGLASAPVHLVAAYSFAFQIYFDFSGYTDMARGIACVLGFELPMNFEEPYLSRDPSEFWQRWHITLSTWLRDYLYIPLGGNRFGTFRTFRNLMITMLLGGLWHGAGINFVLWGGVHGLLLVAYRLLRIGDRRRTELGLRDIPAIFVLFNLVTLAWVPFRADTLQDVVWFFKGLVSSSYLRAWPIVPSLVVALCVVAHIAERYVRVRLPAIHARVGASRWGTAMEGALLGAILMLCIFASGAGVEFIYFQF